MEADISIWRKTGHFYFALTRREEDCGPSPDERSNALTGEMGPITQGYRLRDANLPGPSRVFNGS